MNTQLGHWILWCIILFFVSFLFWANQAELNQVTRAQGRVIPSQHIQIIQNLEGGILSYIHIQEGDSVNHNQALLTIDDTRFQADWQTNQLKMQQLQMQWQRLQAQAQLQTANYQGPLSDSQYHYWQQEYALYKAEQASFDAEQNTLKQQQIQRQQQIESLKSQLIQLRYQHGLVKKELNITRPLVKQGVLSELELLQLQRQLSQLQGKKDKIKRDIPRAKASLSEVTHNMVQTQASYRANAQRQRNQVENELQILQTKQKTLHDRLQRTIVRSPVKGIIKRLKVNTIGGVLSPGMDLIEIVPDSKKIIIEAHIRPADIAFLYMGQTAQIKFSAYDFAIFGGLSAKLSHISADSIQDPHGSAYFLIRLQTQTNTLSSLSQNLPILPGMTVNVELLNGRKTILNYLLKPIQKIRARALRES